MLARPPGLFYAAALVRARRDRRARAIGGSAPWPKATTASAASTGTAATRAIRRPRAPRAADRQGAPARQGAQARPQDAQARRSAGRRSRASPPTSTIVIDYKDPKLLRSLPVRDRQDPAAPHHGQHREAAARGRGRGEARAPPGAAALPAGHGLATRSGRGVGLRRGTSPPAARLARPPASGR